MKYQGGTKKQELTYIKSVLEEANKIKENMFTYTICINLNIKLKYQAQIKEALKVIHFAKANRKK